MLALSRHALSANLVDLQEMAGHPRNRGQQGSHALTHSLLVIVKHYLAIKRFVISLSLSLCDFSGQAILDRGQEGSHVLTSC